MYAAARTARELERSLNVAYLPEGAAEDERAEEQQTTTTTNEKLPASRFTTPRSDPPRTSQPDRGPRRNRQRLPYRV